MHRLVFVLVALCLVSLPARAGFRAGIASRVVTPNPLLPVSGGIGPGNPSTNKQGELMVTALVWENGPTRVAVVSTDFLGFPSALGKKIRAQVKGIPPGNILIGATHTHSAPDCYGFPNERGGTDADLKYLARVCDLAAAAINEAVDKLQPATLKMATGQARGKIAYNYYAPDLYDPRCHVIQAIGADGKPFATLVNYAVHPEVIGARRGTTSPDLIGPLRDRIQERGGGKAIFMNSAQGGMVTADNRTATGEANSWEECQRIGNLLADEALRLVEKAPVQTDPPLFCAARDVTFPIDSAGMRAIIKASPVGLGTGDDTKAVTQINVINLGTAQMLTIPGEALPNIGFYLKRKMHGEHNLLFGLTNDAFGYMLTKVDWNGFKRYDYVSRTSLGEMTGEILIEEGLKFVNECPRPAKAP
jgi:hypothetical protein